MLALCGCSGFVYPWRAESAGRGCRFSCKARRWWRMERGGGGGVGGEVLPRFVVARSRVSSRIGLDSQTFQAQDLSQMLWVGPVPGDIAEVEAYCRIFRAAERLHTVIMETLCSSLTGECVVSYDTPSEDMSASEEKVVAVLGCMVALLNQGREDVLSGRSSFMNSFEISDVSLLDGKLPPLAVFRGEMKRCCESLHIALENYLTPYHESSITIWRGLHRLKNVCYDAGFSRGDCYPCPTLFANWRPVYFSGGKDDMVLEDSEIAFWRGGQVTDEGLAWLLEKGFKLIVDLRNEIVRDECYQSAIEQAVSSGKIEVINLPVEVGTAPSMEQVEQFASFVLDSSRRPLYLHSQEGVGRTSAMISRWRQYTTRTVRHAGTNSSNNSKPTNNTKSLETLDLETIVLQNSKGNNSDNKNHSEFHSVNTLHPRYKEEGIPATQKECHTNKATHKLESVRNITASGVTSNAEVESVSDFSVVSNSLKAQLPVRDIFSKKEMAQFFKGRKVSPTTYFHAQRKRFAELFANARKEQKVVFPDNETLLGNPLSNPMQPGISNGRSTDRLSPRTSTDIVSNGNISSGSFVSCDLSLNGLQVVKTTNVAIGTETLSGSGSNSSNPALSSIRQDNKTKTENGFINSASDSSDLVEVDMCASATGVVRVQSRRKAEMFLVRTDGFSCTREKVTESSLAFTHPSTQQQMLMWKSPPKTILLLKKLGDELLEEAKEVASFLFYQEKMNVLVEPDVHDIFARIPGFGFVQTFYSQDTSDLHDRVDFVACLGGDGVILHASNLFRGAVPPVVSFNLGSLGFLTSHIFEEYRQDLRAVIHGNNTRDGVYITLRMRLRCEIFRKGKAVPGKVFDVVNEVVVDRGSNPYLAKIECYEHTRLITKVQGDGVIVATPTGSTAYSTAAGGSMVHPNVPCMLFTPICPHSLSFRPVILPDSAQLELKIPEDARSNAWVSFDGKRRQQLSRGDSVRISMSQHPLPTVNKFDQTGDWFRSLIRCLNWNERRDQKAL
ncbi:probable NAD kinase 2, chloroplastic isoform X1 [Dioscorea cayenensis subsp. rotundata]|uniref:NAD(+) kinase n=2 Tax=Dioscorea cayennensis subsp. rotundata TaxID=55577 RepID=A0AB40B1N8_DIOCR|nr:probable NAD kinase 2, chloroplastic isoform X1 [Dioscorea cayenensis subsp. rotundata]